MRSKFRLQVVIRSRLDFFERRCWEGWTYAMLADELAKEGIEITENYFGRCLRNAKKERDAAVGRRSA